MNQTRLLSGQGQSIWIDNLTRAMLDDSALQGYIDNYAVTGLTSNPTIFEKAIAASSAYDADILRYASSTKADEKLLMELAVRDIQRAADLFRPVYESSDHTDGFVSLEISPLVADDSAASIAAAAQVHQLVDRPNLLVKIPGTPAGLVALEESIYAGIPVNVTLLFSDDHYLAAAAAYLRGIERRVAAGLSPRVASVASVFVSRWDRAANDHIPEDLRNRLGIAVAQSVYAAYGQLLSSARWRQLSNRGARPQRLLWASTGSKDSTISDTIYVSSLVAPDTINTMPEATLRAFADHGTVPVAMTPGVIAAQALWRRFLAAGIDVDELATRLQREGALAFVQSWIALLANIAAKRRALGAPMMVTG